MNDKYILLLKRQLEEVEKIGTNESTVNERSYGVEAWKSATISILETIFGQKSKKIEEIEKIELKSRVSLNGPTIYYVQTVKERARAILNACITELEILGNPNQIYTGEKEGLNLNITQNQQNTQTVNLSIIIEELRKELNGNQLEEIQNILDSEETTEEKKKSIGSKLKDFGINTLSNIIAGIITNPSIYS
ncbi:hypothetical protein [Chishuiella sp.]|uniref:hypothetical protein n=1 Tax=Chishuiella sp. TaxID=1969467 RepID=UPI0028ACA729|nr:hypothetical protein [Chishuiella sp.]